MKKIKHISIVLAIMLFAFSCKKEHAPISTTTPPEFYFNGTVGGTSTSLTAGVNNYYMYSSYLQDSNNVYNFIGDLKQINSSLISIQIQINDYTASNVNAAVFNIDSSLTPKNYVYYSPANTVTATATTSVTVYNVQFNSSYANGTPQTYNWNFGDGSTSTLANPMHTYSQLAFYNVCLSVTGTNSCGSSICDTVNLSSPTAYSCYATISSSVIPSSNSVSFSTTATGTAPFNYNWNFGDSMTYDSTNNTAYHSYANAGTYTVTLRVTDANNKVAIAKYNVTTALAPVSCITNFNVTNIQAVTTTTPTTTTYTASELGDVVVTWTDASGNVYTSKSIAQPAGSNFQVLSTDNYQNNTNGQRTKKLHVKFSCWLYNSTHPPIQITNADAVIAVAYK